MRAIRGFCPAPLFPLLSFSSYASDSRIAHAPPGTVACTFDISAFHRSIPIHPSHKRFAIFQWRGGFFLDHCHPFGVIPASSNAGQVGGAVKRIWNLRLQRRGISLRYEDDFTAFLFALLEQFGWKEFIEIIDDLGIQWGWDKCGTAFTAQFNSLGFSWDIPGKIVTLMETKRVKYLARVNRILNGDMVTLRDLQAIHGTLSYSTFIHRDGSSRLPAISNAFRFYDEETEPRWLLRTTREALEWWKERLSEPNFSRRITVTPELTDMGLFVDASTDWGVAGLIGVEWFAFRLLPGWQRDGLRDICWLECVALELLLLYLAQSGVRSKNLLIHSDSMGAIGALTKGRSSNAEINRVARRFQSVSSSCSISFSLTYIESALNPADAPSRGILPLSPPLARHFDIPSDIAQSLVEFSP